VILFFVEEDVDPVDASKQFHDLELAKLSQKDAIFVQIPYNPDRTPSLSDGSPIPTSKLLSPNPSRDYNITSYPTFLVCDHFGNEYVRHTKVPAPSAINKDITALTEHADAKNKLLQKNLDAAKAALEKKDTRKFFTAVLKNFKEGVIGLEAQNESIKVYRELVDKTREEINEILETKPTDAEKRLKALSKDFKDTEVEADIKDALEIIKG
jgi:hypothetical protein